MTINQPKTMTQREIKYRAWDKRNAVMFYGIENGITFDDDSHYKFSDFLANTDRWEVMQYTGLKDKNGKEIYEGDIVTEDGEETGNIIFDDACFYHSHGGVLEQLSETHDVVEVIGNIYQDSHLLESK